MKRDNNSNVSSSNFGLSIVNEQKKENSFDSDFDMLFGLSKSEQRLKRKEREMELERKKAEIIAVSQIMNEQVTQQTGMGMGQVLLIGGAIILVCFGAYSLLKKKPVESAENIIDSTPALTV